MRRTWSFGAALTTAPAEPDGAVQATPPQCISSECETCNLVLQLPATSLLRCDEDLKSAVAEQRFEMFEIRWGWPSWVETALTEANGTPLALMQGEEVQGPVVATMVYTIEKIPTGHR